jgi:hypothetical protein
MHHSKYSQDPVRLNKIADRFAKYLIKTYPDKEFVLLYRGLSGSTLSTAIGMYLAKLKHIPGYIYVRKSGEYSHGYGLEMNINHIHNPLFVICDDFVSSGDTIEQIIIKVGRYNTQILDYFTPENTVVLLGHSRSKKTVDVNPKDFVGAGEYFETETVTLDVIDLSSIHTGLK